MKKPIIRFLSYFAYIISIGYIVFKGTEYQKSLEKIKLETYHAYPEMVFLSIFPIFIGILLAIPRFFKVFKKKGVWFFDRIKFIAIGLPTLYLAIFPAIFFSPIVAYIPQTIGNIMLMYSMFPQFLSGIIFGYLLINVIDKEFKV